MEKRAALLATLLCVAMIRAAEPPATQPAVQWLPERMRFATAGSYARIARVNANTQLLVYEDRRIAYARRSMDDGRNWTEPTVVASNSEGTCTNSQPLVLGNGRVLYFYDFRPNRDRSDLAYQIMLCTSDDGGRSWRQRAEPIYTAGTKFGDGCWEPGAIQLPSGEIQMFFANESPYRNSDEQEITLMRSADNGETWSKPETVSFRPGHRDGMPVPLVLASGKSIVFAIEDNGLNGEAFKPAIIDSLFDRAWEGGTVGADSVERRAALRSPLPDKVYAGAPYICQMANGKTVLSCQSDEDSKNPIMTIYVGDSDARNFAGKTHPFPADLTLRGMWNSLFVKNANTVTAVSSADINGKRGIWLIDGIVP